MGSQDLRSNQKTPPPVNFTCFSDAAWRSDNRNAGLGWILRNKDTIIAQGSRLMTNVSSPLMAEALAIRETLFQIQNRKLRDVHIFSDSKSLINLINTRGHHSEIFGILQDIARLSLDLTVSSFSFISRSDNRDADEIAKSALYQGPVNTIPFFLSV